MQHHLTLSNTKSKRTREEQLHRSMITQCTHNSFHTQVTGAESIVNAHTCRARTRRKPSKLISFPRDLEQCTDGQSLNVSQTHLRSTARQLCSDHNKNVAPITRNTQNLHKKPKKLLPLWCSNCLCSTNYPLRKFQALSTQSVSYHGLRAARGHHGKP